MKDAIALSLRIVPYAIALCNTSLIESVIAHIARMVECDSEALLRSADRTTPKASRNRGTLRRESDRLYLDKIESQKPGI